MAILPNVRTGHFKVTEARGPDGDVHGVRRDDSPDRGQDRAQFVNASAHAGFSSAKADAEIY